MNPAVRDGYLHTASGEAIYVPLCFPVILSFFPEDTTGVAYPTPDYGEPRPKGRPEGRHVSPPDTRIHEHSTLYDETLSVEIPSPDSLQFDLYSDEMKYMHSLRVSAQGGEDPEEAVYAHEPGLLVTIQEATVNLYDVQLPE